MNNLIRTLRGLVIVMVSIVVVGAIFVGEGRCELNIKKY